jgi:prolyl-tRNA editing enzyme YbaK/EbsC (Cys-tRNA(Pro) deacylase)
MIVLVNLKEDVAPQEYEHWLQERYVPAILDLASVDEWRGYRVGGLPESGSEPPYEYVVSVANRYNASWVSSAGTRRSHSS